MCFSVEADVQWLNLCLNACSAWGRFIQMAPSPSSDALWPHPRPQKEWKDYTRPRKTLRRRKKRSRFLPERLCCWWSTESASIKVTFVTLLFVWKEPHHFPLVVLSSKPSSSARSSNHMLQAGVCADLHCSCALAVPEENGGSHFLAGDVSDFPMLRSSLCWIKRLLLRNRYVRCENCYIVNTQRPCNGLQLFAHLVGTQACKDQTQIPDMNSRNAAIVAP